MSISHEDVLRLLQLLDASHFDELDLEADGVKFSLRRHGAPAVAVREPAPAPSPAEPKPAAVAPASVAAADGASGLLEIRSPMLGAFYSAPKPGAAPFVIVGTRVGRDSVIAIIEVMKLMNSIAAGVEGEVVEIMARDGELVEFDQLLMRVRPL